MINFLDELENLDPIEIVIDLLTKDREVGGEYPVGYLTITIQALEDSYFKDARKLEQLKVKRVNEA